MVNVTYTPTSSDLVYYEDDGTEVIYNLGDMAWSESHAPHRRTVAVAPSHLPAFIPPS
jgi:hypothetical protein